MAAAAETEAAKLKAAAKANAAEVAKRAHREIKKPKTQQIGTGPSTRAAARAAAAGASTTQVHITPPNKTKNSGAPPQKEDHQQDIVE